MVTRVPTEMLNLADSPVPLALPRWTELTKEPSPQLGSFGFNEESDSFEGFTSAGWGPIGGGGGGGWTLFNSISDPTVGSDIGIGVNPLQLIMPSPVDLLGVLDTDYDAIVDFEIRLTILGATFSTANFLALQANNTSNNDANAISTNNSGMSAASGLYRGSGTNSLIADSSSAVILFPLTTGLTDMYSVDIKLKYIKIGAASLNLVMDAITIGNANTVLRTAGWFYGSINPNLNKVMRLIAWVNGSTFKYNYINTYFRKVTV